MNQKNFSFKKALEKGGIGEEIIREYLEGRGWIVYQPKTKGRPHYFDMLCTKDKRAVIAVDVKTKARLNKWAAQGINRKSYEEYLQFVDETQVPFWLIFIDDKTGEVYAADITALHDPIYPNNNVIAWPLSQMKKVMVISSKKIAELSKLDQRNYAFDPEMK